MPDNSTVHRIGPLVAQAQRLIQATRAAAADNVVRIGVPAGTTEFFDIINMRAIAQRVRTEHPGATMRAVNVHFPALRTCLADRRVDLLLTIGPVLEPTVQSVSLPVTANRMGIVHARHNFAEAGAMDVSDFADVPVIYNPHVPDEFMGWFWLGDIRPRREAQLEPVRAADKDAAIGGITDNAVMVTLERARARLPPQLKPVGLTDAAPVQFYAARRCDDRNALLRSLFAILEQLKPIQF